MLLLFVNILFLSTSSMAMRKMSTILQNVGVQCYEARHGLNPAFIKLNDIQIGQVIPSSGVFDISLKNITIQGFNNYKVQEKDDENCKF